MAVKPFAPTSKARRSPQVGSAKFCLDVRGRGCVDAFGVLDKVLADYESFVAGSSQPPGRTGHFNL